VPVALAALEERAAIGRIVALCIELPHAAIPTDTVALHVAQVRNRGAEPGGSEAHQPYLDDRAATAVPSPRAPHGQRPRCHGAAPEPAADEAPPAAPPKAGALGRRHDGADVFAPSPDISATRAPQPRLEFEVVHANPQASSRLKDGGVAAIRNCASGAPAHLSAEPGP